MNLMPKAKKVFAFVASLFIHVHHSSHIFEFCYRFFIKVAVLIFVNAS